jgi:SEC-C motif-containing protein
METGMVNCPCGSNEPFDTCCGPLLSGDKSADTAAALMRSRYTAYTRAAIDYLLSTTHPDKKDTYDVDSMRSWAEESDWQGLEIIAADKGGPDDDTGQVEFIARYSEQGENREHHEIADFKKQGGNWFFYDGQAPSPTTYVRKEPKIGRNAPCPCNSGKKYKKCCGR